MQHIVVLTEFKEIFFGECEDAAADVLTLKNARQAVYYSAETHGFLGLATDGPAAGSRIGPAVKQLVVHKPVNVVSCSESAVGVWQNAKWE